MDKIVNNPGFQHITEKILLSLDYKDLLECKFINKSFKEILEGPMFWLKKWRLTRGLSKKNHHDWIKAVQITKNTILEEDVDSYIKMIIKIGHFVDVPCYIDSKVVSEFSNYVSFAQAFKENNMGIVQLLAAKNIKDTKLSIAVAIGKNQVDLIKVLAPLLEDPNDFVWKGMTPISMAADKGYLDVIKVLAPLTKDPNSPVLFGETPLHYAVMYGHVDIIKYLAPLTKNLNFQDNFGNTPIFDAIILGQLQCVKVLAPFCKNPNAPHFDGTTPIQMAERLGHDEIKGFLQSYKDAPVS